MIKLNIFESIKDTQSREEPFHTTFIYNILKEAWEHDRRFFEDVWRLVTPSESSWPVPEKVDIESEKQLYSDQYGSGRIDIMITDRLTRHKVGIEVKTSDSSVEQDQLQRYLCGLKFENSEQKSDEPIAICFLTPFNQPRFQSLVCQNSSESESYNPPRAIRIFDEFHSIHENSRHISWLDVAEIDMQERNDLWEQHREYVRNHICSAELLKRTGRNRDFDTFFDESSTGAFWKRIEKIDSITPDPLCGTEVDLDELGHDHVAFVDALDELINNNSTQDNRSNRSDRFPEDREAVFLNSRFGDVHKMLFELARKYPNTWIEGEFDYGVRIHLRNHPSVSLVRSKGVSRLSFGAPR